MRIVSFLSSATEIVHLLGLQERLVAISHECDYPPESLHLPRVSRPRFDPVGLGSAEIDAAVRRSMEEFGSVYEVDRERLAELSPDLLLTQAVCEVCAVPTGSVEEAISTLARSPRILSLDAHTIAGILDSVLDVGTAAGAPGEARRAVESLQLRLATVAARVADRPRPRVLLLEWVDPPFAPGHWVPELVDLAGGENLVGMPGTRSSQLRWEQLEGLDPDVLLLAPCGYDLEQAHSDADSHLDRLRRIAPAAMERGSAWVLHSAYFSRSGPRVVDGAEILAEVLHPGAGTELAGRAERWPRKI